MTFAAPAAADATHGDTGVLGGATGDQTGVLMQFHPPSSSAPASSTPPSSAPPPHPAAPTFGVVPPEFTVIAPETVARLDNIDTIVVVMMENRSFDHLLGHLRQRRSGAGYTGFTGDEVNEINGVTPGVRMLPATQANIPGSVTAIPNSPEHGIDHVIPQIDGGRMSGFAQDYENRYPDDGIGQWVMTYYTEAELPTYYQLADRFTVCDHWFASHPGDTWPNRWTTLSGHTPFLQNPPIDEPSIGFMPQPTIFDLLDSRGIDWRVFESDLSLLRTFARYRLDATHLVPFVDPDDHSRNFEVIARAGKLPPVVFVEPNFSDVPPLSTADDDLSPVDLAKGQRFVASVFDALSTSTQWAHTLMIVVYDEHGGSSTTSPRRERRSGHPSSSARSPASIPTAPTTSACASRRSSPRRGWRPAGCAIRCSTTPRSSRRSCCATAPSSTRPTSRSSGHGSTRQPTSAWPSARSPLTSTTRNRRAPPSRPDLRRASSAQPPPTTAPRMRPARPRSARPCTAASCRTDRPVRRGARQRRLGRQGCGPPRPPRVGAAH